MSATHEIDAFLLEMLVCPVTRSPLKQDGDFLVAEVGGLKYPITDQIPRLLPTEAVLPDGYANLDEFKAEFCKAEAADDEDEKNEE